MRGSIYYQISQLASVIYGHELPKNEQKKLGKLSNTSTTAEYAGVWTEIALHTANQYKIKDMQLLSIAHIENYLYAKYTYGGISIQRAEIISSAIGKLEVALKLIAAKFKNAHNYHVYDFSSRSIILKEAKQLNMFKKGSKAKNHSRAYSNPLGLIECIENEKYKLAALIQYESGARVDALRQIFVLKKIKYEKLLNNKLDYIEIIINKNSHVFIKQLQGIHRDPYTQILFGNILTVEKGGKPGIVKVSVETYQKLQDYLDKHSIFEINYNSYLEALKDAAKQSNQNYTGSHGLRWNFAQNRMIQLQKYNLSAKEAEQIVSWEMKHERPTITQHYLR